MLHYRLVKVFQHGPVEARAAWRRSRARAGGFAGEVPDGDGEGEGAEEVGHHGHLSAMNLPAFPEGDGGGQQHDEASNVGHGRVLSAAGEAASLSYCDGDEGGIPGAPGWVGRCGSPAPQW